MKNLSPRLNITIAFLAKRKIIELHIGRNGLPIWFALTVHIERFLRSDQIVAVLKQDAPTASRWLVGQVVFDRILKSDGPVRISTAEANACADLLACVVMTDRNPSILKTWKRPLLKLWANVARSRFDSYPEVSFDGSWNAIIRHYNNIRHRIDAQSGWLTLDEARQFFLILKDYNGEHLDIRLLKDRLEVASHMYRLSLEVISRKSSLKVPGPIRLPRKP